MRPRRLERAAAQPVYGRGADGGLRPVAHDDDRGAGARPTTKRGEDHRAVGVVEASGRLVGQQQRRIVQHRAAEGDALLLAARELRREMVAAIRDADLGQEIERPLSGRRPRAPDVARPRPAPRGAAERGHAVVLVPHVAAVAGLEQPEDVQQRALARARRAGDDDDLARLHGQVDAAQHANRRPRRGPVRLDEPDGAQHQLARRIASAGETETTRAVAYAAAAVPSRTENARAPPSRRGEKWKSCWLPPATKASMNDPSESASAMPARPPTSVTASASASTSRPSCRSVAPSARFTPKSRMRSKTAAATVLASERPPMTKARTPMPASSAEKNAVDERRSWLSSLGSWTLTPGTRSRMRSATASGSSPSRHPTAAPVLRSEAVSGIAPEASTVRRSASFATHCARASAVGAITNRSGAVHLRPRTPTTWSDSRSSPSRRA